jgi:hypothetical protein
MLRSSLLAVLCLCSCSEASTSHTESTDVRVDEPASISAEPAGEVGEAPAKIEPSPDSSISEPTSEQPPPSSKREIVRLRCKPHFTPCYGGRECCDDRFEVCGKDNHCHPLE